MRRGRSGLEAAMSVTGQLGGINADGRIESGDGDVLPIRILLIRILPIRILPIRNLTYTYLTTPRRSRELKSIES